MANRQYREGFYSFEKQPVALFGVLTMTGTGPNTFDSVTDNSSNWDTAHGWGDHSAASFEVFRFGSFLIQRTRSSRAMKMKSICQMAT